MCYQMCKTIIQRGTYDSKEKMQENLDVFLLNNRITREQYEELTKLLEAK